MPATGSPRDAYVRSSQCILLFRGSIRKQAAHSAGANGVRPMRGPGPQLGCLQFEVMAAIDPKQPSPDQPPLHGKILE
ncbi:hypothetical protein [Ramlibacter pinisoli]|uniref:Uncharacterized protein n=2 Tax=Ramlibacter TaxID=174951 RepID=A0A6N8ITU0_9BURK|nr:hypothetical protein [Ramlibacter pinisoli]MVQ30122.1 hypothetical protein [Ramlibacter pinisoli]